MTVWKLIQGDCREVLAKMESDSVHCCITDPPYHLTSSPDGSRGFMGKSWDGGSVSFQVDTWKEVLRVLKPGGFLLVFSSCRTYHRMACAVEDAGFVIHPMFSILGWVQSQGMPKGVSVDKALDKRAGAKREVIGPGNRHTSRKFGAGAGDPDLGTYAGGVPDITAPATDEARRWAGWSYGLQSIKPAIEPILCAQKPYEKGKALDSILRHEVGAYNVNACRVETKDSLNGGAYAKEGSRRNDPEGAEYGFRRDAGLEYVQPSGRVPSNVLLVHAPGCRKVGVQQVKNASGSIKGDEPSTPADGEVYGEFDRVPFQRHGGADGIETVDQYECVEGCSVATLANQSGHSKTNRIEKPSDCRGNTWGGTIQQNRGARGHTDEGTAARFFPQFELDGPPFLYCGKASFREKEAGLLGVVRCPVCGELSTTRHVDQGGVEQKCRRNIHPTVKPVKLMSWMVRLVTRPDNDSVILDPFCGSGSTGVAVMMEGGRRFIGIDQDAQALAIAEARIRHWDGTVEPNLLDGVD